MAALKGQNLRVFSGSQVIGEATACVITMTNNTAETSTKNDTGLSAKPSVVSKSWQVQVDSLNVADVGAYLDAIKDGTSFILKWDQAAGSLNGVAQNAGFRRSGTAFISDATFVWNDREFATKQVTFIGSGPISTPS